MVTATYGGVLPMPSKTIASSPAAAPKSAPIVSQEPGPHTSIRVLLDASGSMQDLVGATTESTNGYFAEQASERGTVDVSVWTFSGSDTLTEILHNVPLKIPSPSGDGKLVLNPAACITPENYKCGGGTALNESLGTLLDISVSTIAAMQDPPAHKIFVTVTDGEENASTGRFGGTQGQALVRSWIEGANKESGWEFVFLAANMDAQQVGSSYGFKPEACTNFVASDEGVTRGMTTVSAYTSSLRA